ncbi:hypothetical protein [Methylomonas albis]|uniref:Uncharacterized protein n=1 Tax=Methylomonas albis TaxID=1854563 RepID=A0ABR9CV50_9GAMM|nr:hypothetical protein [Methylomonas albis]MBD9354708.1 hypothetical protein [Methylomonas albis]
MQAIEIFSLKSHAGEYQDWPLRTQLLINGLATSSYVPGYRLLHQFKTSADEYLLICDWDCPFEEATEIILLGSQLNVLAVRSLGVPYGSFWLDEVLVLDNVNLKLTFFRDEHWQVTVTSKNLACLHFSSRSWLPALTTRIQLKRL